MRRTLPLITLLALLLNWATAGFADDSAWTPLFDGKTLEGWKVNGGFAKYRVEDGAIVGTTVEGSPNTFLCKGDFQDFELEFEVKCDPRLNSGVQVRSHVYRNDDPDPKNRQRTGVVYGPQCEIARNETGTAGRFYDEGRRGQWLDEIKPEAKAAFKNDGWNQYRIVVEGHRYRSWINGVAASDFHDDLDEKGFIGLQVHGIPKGEGPFEVRWRDVRIREKKPGEPSATGPRFSIRFGPELGDKPVDGRLLLMLSTDPSEEPRFQITDGLETQQVFGLDLEGAAADRPVVVDAGALGYPVESLRRVPRGTYRVQALLHRYETFQTADGRSLKLPMDRGEGQQWNKAPGNVYSVPKEVSINPDQADPITITLDQVIPPIPEPATTKYIKHEKIESKLLSKFWGRPMHLGAHILLPEGFEEHPDAHYPLVIFHGHHPDTFGGFRETPPDPNLKPDYSDRFKLPGYNRIVQEHAYQFYKEWTGPNFPRMIIIEIQHANPFYDDSYAVNSANLGPYGDAITYELIPYLEKKYRAIGAGWARFLYGGSTGGWEALAAQVFYPEEYNGCFAACPDPIDFRAYTVVNLYEDKNAYYADGPWRRVARPGMRDHLGHISTTLENMNRRELVLGTKSRSGQQWDIWEAVYSPVGPDGYPKRIWDKQTGVIDPSVAAYWRENYDLSHILKRDWPKIGRKLEGKIHLYVGEADNYYLNNAVHLVEEFLNSTRDPFFGGEVAYGCQDEHCWNGDPTRPNALSRLRYHQMYVSRIVDRLLKTAPPGGDVTSWRY